LTPNDRPLFFLLGGPPTPPFPYPRQKPPSPPFCLGGTPLPLHLLLNPASRASPPLLSPSLQTNRARGLILPGLLTFSSPHPPFYLRGEPGTASPYLFTNPHPPPITLLLPPRASGPSFTNFANAPASAPCDSNSPFRPQPSNLSTSPGCETGPSLLAITHNQYYTRPQTAFYTTTHSWGPHTHSTTP